MQNQIVLLLITFVLFSQTALVSADSLPAPYEDIEAYEVYAAILPSEWPIQAAKAKALVIRAETKNYKSCLEPEAESAQVIGSAIAAYVKLNEKTWLLQRKFDSDMSYTLLTAEQLKITFAQGGWETFYKSYPDSGGWIELSAVGFNADKTVAVVYLGHSCGMLCGGGDFHVLQKQDGKWMPLAWKGMRCGWRS